MKSHFISLAHMLLIVPYVNKISYLVSDYLNSLASVKITFSLLLVALHNIVLM